MPKAANNSAQALKDNLEALNLEAATQKLGDIYEQWAQAQQRPAFKNSAQMAKLDEELGVAFQVVAAKNGGLCSLKDLVEATENRGSRAAEKLRKYNPHMR